MSGVTIKTLQQKTFKIDIEHTETVKTLKEKIQEAKGEEFPADMLKLIYAGKILDDTQQLTKYKIQPNGFVVVMVSKTRTTPKPTPAPAPEASASTTVTSEETSTETQETSTPATTETTQPSAEPPRTETDGETRMETSEAAPTAQGSDTSSNRGEQALQQAGSNLAVGDALDEAISNLMALGYERDQVVRALNASFNNPDRAAEMLISGNVPDVVQPPQGQDETEEGSGEQPTRDTPSQQASGERGNPFEFLRATPQFQHLRQLVQQNPQALPAVLNQIGQANPQLIRLIAGNQQAFIDLLNEPAPSDSGSAGSSSSGGASAPPQAPSGGTPPAMQGAMPPGMPGGMPPGMQGMMPPGMQGAMPPGVQQQGPGVFSIPVTPEEKEAVERLKALGFSEADVIQAYFACDKNEELTANFLLSDDNN